jgi:hypothetical protein
MVYVWPLSPSSYEITIAAIVVINEAIRETSAIVA